MQLGCSSSRDRESFHPGSGGTTYMRWLSASARATREAVNPRPHVTFRASPLGRESAWRSFPWGALRPTQWVRFAVCSRVPKALAQILSSTRASLSRIFLEVAMCWDPSGQWRSHVADFLLRRPLTVSGQNTENGPPAFQPELCLHWLSLSHLPRLSLPNFLLLKSAVAAVSQRHHHYRESDTSWVGNPSGPFPTHFTGEETEPQTKWLARNSRLDIRTGCWNAR